MVVRLLHRPKFQIFYTESNVMVKVARYLHKSEAAVHRCLQPFIEKRLFMSILFTKVAGLHPKERKLCLRSFPRGVPNVSENIFCKT